MTSIEEARVIAAAIEFDRASPGRTPRAVDELRDAVAALLAVDPAARHAGAYGACPDYGNSNDPCRPGCASGVCVVPVDPPQWVERTWVDVRQGDIVRPPGVEGADAKVTAIGPVVPWGVNDIQPLDAYQQRDIQYNPGRYAGTYAVRKATLKALADQASAPMTRDMKPDAPVEIEMTASEVRAIELLGGWQNRV